MQTDHKILFGIIGSLMILYAHSIYIISIFKNKTKPHLVTWGIWTIATVTVFFAQFISNAGPACWGTGISGITCSIVVIITLLKKTTSSIKNIDIILLIISIFAIILWGITSNPLYSVIILTTIDVLGYIPTIRKTYYHPSEEKISTYTISSARHILSLFSLNDFSATNTIFQIGMILANSVLIFIWILRKNDSNKIANAI